MKAESSGEILDGLVSSGRVQPADAELLRGEIRAAEKRGFARAGAIVSWGTAIIVAVYCAAQMPGLMAVPRFKLMFEGMNLGSLPQSTELLISVPIWAYMACGFLLIAGILVKEVVIRNRVVNLTINCAAVVAVLLGKAFMTWALFAPMIKMMEMLGAEGGSGGG